jgi:hypothetical protein
MTNHFPKYPVAPVDERPAFDGPRRAVNAPPPRDLYLAPSFKFRHEVRRPLASGDDAYYRAYPQFKPRRLSARRARWQAIRNGS